MPVFNNVLAGAAGQGGASDYTIKRSLRFNSADSSNLSFTAAAGNRQTFTLSWWMKRCVINESNRRIFGKSTGSQQFSIMHDANGRFYVYTNLDSPSDTSSIVFAPQYRDPSAWAHYCLAFDSTQATDSNRIKFYYNGVQVTEFEGTPNWPTQNASFKWNNASDTYYIGGIGTYHINAYLADIHHVDGQQLDCTSFGEFSEDTGVWNPIRYTGTFGTNGFHLDFSDASSLTALGNDAAGSNNWTPNNLQVNSQLYATGALTAVNGVLAPASNPFWIDFLPTNADVHYASSNNTDNMKFVHDGLTTTSAYWVGNLNSPSYGGNVRRARFDLTSFGTITSCRVYGGFASGYVNYKYRMLDSSKTLIAGSEGTFGAPSWHTMQVTGNPKYIEISCEHTTSTDTRHRTYAIEVNGVVLVNGGAHLNDTFFDSPSNYEANSGNNGGNYCVLNPLDKHSEFTTSNGNLDVVTSGSNWRSIRGTIGISSGKYYWEFTTGHQRATVGIATSELSVLDDYIGNNSYSWSYLYDGNKYHNGGIVSYGSSYTAGDIIGVAFDADAGNIYFYKNGTIQNNGTAAYTGLTSGPYFPSFSFRDSGNTFTANFGASSFAYTPPTGYKSLCTQNLDDPLIADGSAYFDVTLRTSDTTQSKSVTGLAFSPDLIWEKPRSVSQSHYLADTVRGVTSTLSSDSTSGETTYSAFFTSSNSDGYTIGTNDFTHGTSVVGWAWDGGDLVTGTYSSYNQSQNWIANTSGAVFGGVIEDLFDTATSTGIYPGSGGTSGTFDVTLTFSPGIACTSLRVYTKDKQSSATGSVSVNGGTHQSVPGNDSWATLTAPSTLNSLVLRRVASSATNNAFRFTAIEVNGRILIGPGVIPAGGLNSSVYNQSQRWRDYLTSTQSFATNYGKEKAFDGVFTGDGGLATLGVVTFTPPAMTVTSLEVNVYSDLTVTLPDGTNVSVTGVATNDVYRTLDIGSGFSFTGSNSITFTPNTGSYVYIDRIRINGKELVDDDVTVTNVPTIASTVRANPTAGFSIVKWTGTGSAGSLGHGLQKKPELIITKVSSSNYNDNWPVYHKAYGAGTYLYFNSNIAAPASYLGFFNGVEPTSSVFTVGTANSDNTKDLIAYCFTSVEGYSKFTSHTVRSGTNFVYLGFRPRLVWLKRTGAGTTTNISYASWAMFDTERDTFNEVDFDTILYANRSHAEGKRGDSGGSTGGSYLNIDILSNGIRFQSGSAEFSQPNDEILVCAWAEHPFKNSRAR